MSKKLVSLAAVLMLLVTLMLPATAFTDYDYTKFGGKSATLNKQGRNLYLMSANGLANADAVYDTAAFTELTQSADFTDGDFAGKEWKIDGRQYFSIRPDGYICPEGGAAVIARENTYDRAFQYKINVNIGTIAGNGVYISIYAGKDKVETVAKNAGETYAAEKMVTLQPGERAYVIVDIAGDGAGDSVWMETEFRVWGVNEKDTTDYSAVNEFKYGGNASLTNKQGDQCFYTMYADDTANWEDFSAIEWKECMLAPVGGMNIWVPDMGDVKADYGRWFSIRPDGFCTGGDNIAAAVKWVAPKDGKITLLYELSGGAVDANAQANGGDSVIYYVYNGDEELFKLDIDESLYATGVPEDKQKNTYELTVKKGDELYFAIDNKNNGGFDNPWFGALITYQQDTPPVSTPDSSTAPNPGTGSAAPIALMAVAVLAGAGVVVAAKHRK